MFGPSHEDAQKLAKAVLVLLLTTLTVKKISINLASKPVHILKTRYLKEMFLNSLDKSMEHGHDIFQIILDGASTNVKLVKTTNKALNPTTNDKPTLAAQLKIETSFFHKCQETYPVFCVPRMAKTFRNALFAKGNYFTHPKLTLSCSFMLEAGT